MDQRSVYEVVQEIRHISLLLCSLVLIHLNCSERCNTLQDQDNYIEINEKKYTEKATGCITSPNKTNANWYKTWPSTMICMG